MTKQHELPPDCVDQSDKEIKPFSDHPGDYDKALRALLDKNPDLRVQINAMVERLYEKHGQFFDHSEDDLHVRVWGRSPETRRKVELWWRSYDASSWRCPWDLPEGEMYSFVHVVTHTDSHMISPTMSMDVLISEGGSPVAVMEVGDGGDHLIYRRTLADIANAANIPIKYERAPEAD